MSEYKIKLSREQLLIIRDSLNLHARTILGQLEGELADILWEQKEYVSNLEFDDIIVTMNEVTSNLYNIKKLVWDMRPNESKGVRYSDKSDSMIDMVNAINHKLLLEVRSGIIGNPHRHWNEKEPLIVIERNEPDKDSEE